MLGVVLLLRDVRDVCESFIPQGSFQGEEQGILFKNYPAPAPTVSGEPQGEMPLISIIFLFFCTLFKLIRETTV